MKREIARKAGQAGLAVLLASSLAPAAYAQESDSGQDGAGVALGNESVVDDVEKSEGGSVNLNDSNLDSDSSLTASEASGEVDGIDAVVTESVDEAENQIAAQSEEGEDVEEGNDNVIDSSIGNVGSATSDWVLTKDSAGSYTVTFKYIGSTVLVNESWKPSSKGNTNYWYDAVSDIVSAGDPLTIVVESGFTSIEEGFHYPLLTDSVLGKRSVNIVLPDGLTDISGLARLGSSGTGITFGSIQADAAIWDGSFLYATPSHKDIVASVIAPNGNDEAPDVVIPEGVERVRHYAFPAATGYGNISIPATCEYIKSTCFGGSSTNKQVCESITVDSENSTYELYYGKANITLVKKGKKLSQLTASQLVGTPDEEGVCYADNADGKTRTLVYCPPSLNKTEYEIPDDCTIITAGAFFGCTTLQRVSGKHVQTVGDNAFAQCPSLVSVELGEELTTLGGNVFYGSGLESYTAPSSLTKYGSTAFAGIKNLDLSAMTVTSLGRLTDHSLVSFKLPSGIQQFGGFASSSLTTVDLSEYASLTVLSDFAFINCSSLVDVKLPSSLTTIGDSCFSNCVSLQAIDLFNLSITATPRFMFRKCPNLSSVVLPQGLVEIGSGMFASGDSVSNDGAALTEIVIPDSVTTIGAEAFMNNKNLTKINLPEGLTTIGGGAFRGCTNLRNIILPTSITFIGPAAFAGVYFSEFDVPAQLWSGYSASDSRWSADSAGIASSGALFTGSGASLLGRDDDVISAANKASWIWSDIKTISLENYENDYLPPYMFMGLNKLESVVLPSDINNLREGAFFACTSLKDVYFFSQNVRIAGAGTTGDPTLGWVSVTMPTFSAWAENEETGKWGVESLHGLNLYGLAYSSNDLIAYAEANDCAFVPFVILDGVNSEELFGHTVTGYNSITGIPETLTYTGSDLSSQINPWVRFTDRNIDGTVDFAIPKMADAGRIGYYIQDANGNVLDNVVDPGAYTVVIKGDDKSAFGVKTVSFQVLDPNGQVPGSEPGSSGDDIANPSSQSPVQQVGQPADQQMMVQQQVKSLAQTGDSTPTLLVTMGAAFSALAAGAASLILRRRTR